MKLIPKKIVRKIKKKGGRALSANNGGVVHKPGYGPKKYLSGSDFADRHYYEKRMSDEDEKYNKHKKAAAGWSIRGRKYHEDKAAEHLKMLHHNIEIVKMYDRGERK